LRPRIADEHYRRGQAGVLRDQWRLALGVVVVCVAVAVAVALAQPSRYRATATLVAVPRPTPALASRLSRLAGTPQVLTRATAASGIPTGDLRSSVHASVQRGALVAVSATASTSAAAARRANAVASALTVVGRDIVKTTGGGLAIVDPARPPSSRVSPRPWLNAAVGLLVGLLAAAVVLLVRDRRDRRPRMPAELEELWGFPVVAAMRNVGMNGRIPPDIVEGYRTLRANLFLRSGGDLPHALIVTSAVKNDGKSAIAANLARTLAASGYRVIAVSVDLRDSGLHRHLGVEDATGIADLFDDDTPPRDVVTRVPLGFEDADGTGSLDLLADGSPTVGRSPSLVSPAIEELLADLQEDYHVVVIDAPALLPASETALLAQRPGMELLVVAQSGTTEQREIKRARERLELAGVDALGLVVCGIESD
jgi:Mrp family chromosome partitioning ATPase